MSKKPGLSSSGSLASCLHFAASVLPSNATNDSPLAPETLTKDVLTPIVVDAHRFGLQMTKLTSETPTERGRNPRKLLLQCREKSDDKTRRTLSGIAVADITWDFEGSVADTLEMEMDELQQRARTAGHAICALLSISATEAKSSGDYALVWIPEEQDKSTHRHSMLMYVCPGRVKVVKTVGDLVRKMREEIKTIRDVDDASYCVWSVIAAPKAGGCRPSQPKEFEATLTTDKPPTTSRAIAEGNSPVRLSKEGLRDEVRITQRTTETSSLMPLESREVASNNDTDSDGGSTRSRQKTDDDEAAPAKRPSKASIFCFNRVSAGRNSVQRSESADMAQHEPQRGCEGRELGDGKSVEIDKDDRCEVEAESDLQPSRVSPHGNQEEEDSCAGTRGPELVDDGPPSSSQEEQPPAIRPKWQAPQHQIPESRSLAIERRTQPREPIPHLSHSTGHAIATTGLGARQCRPSCREQMLCSDPSRSPLQTRSPSKSGGSIPSPRIEDTGETQAHQDPPTVHRATIVRVATKQPPANSMFSFNGDSSSDKSHCADSDEVHAGAQQPPDTEPHDRDGGDASATSRPSLPPPTDEPSSPVTPLETLQSSSPPAFGFFPASPRSPMASSPPQVIKPSARDRVRSKLGAKVWWELEYTARQLEREAAKSQVQTDSSSSHSRGSGLLCDGETGARWLTTTHSIQSTATQEASTMREHIVVAPSNAALEAIKEERSTTSASSSVKHVDVDRATSRPRAMDEDAMNKSVHDSSYKQAVSVTVEDQGAVERQQDLSSCVSTNRWTALAKAVRTDSFESGNGIQTRETTSDDIPMPSTATFLASECPASGGVSIQKQSASVIDSPTESCKSRPMLVQATSEAKTSAPAKEATPAAAASLQRDSTPLVQTLNEQSGRQFHRDQSDDDKRGDTHRHLQSDLAHVEHCQQARSTLARSSSEARSLHEESPAIKTPISNKLAVELKPSADTDLPFHVNGRVPISSHAAHSTAKTPSSSPGTSSINPDQDEPLSPLKEAELLPVEPAPESTSIPASRLTRPPPATATATFIPFHDDKTAVATGKKEAATRMDRLNELRQKKLGQLHKAREVALQQQHDKKQKQQDKKPTAFDASESATGGATTVVHHQPRVKRASNRQQLQNAIEFTLLAGQSTERERLAALEALVNSTAESFVVLLKSPKELKFRALYESCTGDGGDDARRIYSVVSTAYAPLRLTADVVAQFFKYSSAKKQFLAVDTRSFTVATDACALEDHLVFKKTTRPRLL